MIKLLAALGLTTALLVSASGCTVRRTLNSPTLNDDIGKLQSEIDLLPPFPAPAPQSGSLWSSGGPGAAMVRDTRAFRVNDLVIIELAESSSGSNQSTTELSRASDSDFAAPFVFGLDNLDEVLTTESDSSFSGDGSTARSSRLSASLTTRVLRVLPNGDLVIAGQKTVMINREKQILTLVGSVRPVDIRASNRVRSSAVGELTVRLWGNGEVDDTVRQGWFMRIMNRIWPF